MLLTVTIMLLCRPTVILKNRSYTAMSFMTRKKKDTIEPEQQTTDSEIREAIGKHIREMRDKLRHSAASIAGKLGISREALTHIETGRNNINATLLWKLAVLFHCDIADFFPDVPDGYAISKVDLNLLAQEDKKAAEWAEKLFGK